MTEGFATVAGDARVWFEVAGEGPIVTFIHPGLWDARTWDREFMRIGSLIAEGIAGARRADIEDADHVVNLRRPGAFEESVLLFRQEVR